MRQLKQQQRLFIYEQPTGNNSIKPHSSPALPGNARLRDLETSCLTGRASGGRALGSPKSSTLHNGRGRGGRSILISQATGEFQQCTFERLTDFLEYNAASCCQAFMVMLHSEGEWWISAAMELDELHIHPDAAAAAAGAGATDDDDDDGLELNLGAEGMTQGRSYVDLCKS